MAMCATTATIRITAYIIVRVTRISIGVSGFYTDSIVCSRSCLNVGMKNNYCGMFLAVFQIVMLAENNAQQHWMYYLHLKFVHVPVSIFIVLDNDFNYRRIFTTWMSLKLFSQLRNADQCMILFLRLQTTGKFFSFRYNISGDCLMLSCSSWINYAGTSS